MIAEANIRLLFVRTLLVIGIPALAYGVPVNKEGLPALPVQEQLPLLEGLSTLLVENLEQIVPVVVQEDKEIPNKIQSEKNAFALLPDVINHQVDDVPVITVPENQEALLSLEPVVSEEDTNVVPEHEQPLSVTTVVPDVPSVTTEESTESHSYALNLPNFIGKVTTNTIYQFFVPPLSLLFPTPPLPPVKLVNAVPENPENSPVGNVNGFLLKEVLQDIISEKLLNNVTGKPSQNSNEVIILPLDVEELQKLDHLGQGPEVYILNAFSELYENVYPLNLQPLHLVASISSDKFVTVSVSSEVLGKIILKTPNLFDPTEQVSEVGSEKLNVLVSAAAESPQDEFPLEVVQEIKKLVYTNFSPLQFLVDKSVEQRSNCITVCVDPPKVEA